MALMENACSMSFLKFANKGAAMNRFHFQLSLALSLALILLFTTGFSVSAAETNPSKNPLERLIQGNQRYVNSTTVCHEDWTAKRSALVENQKPFAVIEQYVTGQAAT